LRKDHVRYHYHSIFHGNPAGRSASRRIVVVNTNIALTRPAGNDITQTIAAKLGVKLQ
jgi:hypothetical protein